MCLDTIKKGQAAKRDIERLNKLPVLIGYKVFRVPITNKPEWEIMVGNGNGRFVTPNRWLTSTNITIDMPNHKDSYPSGFHVYLNKEDAKKRCSFYSRKIAVGVYADNIVAIGTQKIFHLNKKATHTPTIVAKNIWVDKHDIIAKCRLIRTIRWENNPYKYMKKKYMKKTFAQLF